MTASRIRLKILDAIIHTPPELTGDIPGKMAGYVDELLKKLANCCDGAGAVVRCDECIQSEAVLREAKECIRSL